MWASGASMPLHPHPPTSLSLSAYLLFALPFLLLSFSSNTNTQMSLSHLISLSLALILLHTLSLFPLSHYMSHVHSYLQPFGLSLPLSPDFFCPHSLHLFLLLMCFFLWSLSWSLVRSLSPAVFIKELKNGVQPLLWRDEKTMKERRVLYQTIKIYIGKCLLGVYK